MDTILDSQTFKSHLIEYLDFEGLQNRAVDRHFCSVLVHEYQLENDSANIDFSALVVDDFLCKALQRLILVNPYIEAFLVDLRSKVFQLTIENGIPNTLVPLVVSLAEHAELIEYAFFCSDEERTLLLGIKTILESQSQAEDDIADLLEPLVLFLMYEPIKELKFNDVISAEILKSWPQSVQTLFQYVRTDRIEEQLLGHTIETFGLINTNVSKAVMQQYQENPYPRWRDMFHPTPEDEKVSYLKTYPTLDQKVQRPKTFAGELSCLIAGCGTGQQPIWLTSNTKQLKVTAIDLSLPSLAYAKRQAIKLKVDNHIKFLHGDILELDQMKQTFDIIQCSGVLHHMEHPETGLSLLTQRLRPEGLINLGLYSRTARNEIGVNTIRQTQTAASLDSIRSLRKTILEDPSHPLLRSSDFYTASECRDLLSHVQEHQFDLIQIQELLSANNLKFLGFNGLRANVMNSYFARFPGDPLGMCLENWHQFEQENPTIFKAMYQFHCQKIA